MSVQIQIQGTIVNFPSSGESPNWAPAVIEFAQLVEAALGVAVGPYDVTSQTFNIDGYNTGGTTIPNLTFDNSVVRSAKITISTYRTNTSPSIIVSETRDINITYNPSEATNNKWQIQQERTGGDASISFSVTDAGVFSFVTTSIGSGTHTGILSYSARALTQS
tara:strand:+ start:5300 stop:5791 length:492 start_codon:yes stop_codon:yes gene_type:complete